MSQINTENLTLAYDGRVVLSDLSFSVERGDYVCIIGENGSGKSTLVRALLGLKHPLSGKITFDDGLCRRDIGYIPQKTDVERDFPATVREVVMSGLVGEHVFPSLSKDCKSRSRDGQARDHRHKGSPDHRPLRRAEAACAFSARNVRLGKAACTR